MEQRHQGEKFRLLDAALPATAPSAPNRTRLMVVGLALSVGLAALAVVVAEHRDTSFHTLSSLRALVKVPILASIPSVVTENDRRRMRWRFWPISASVAVLLLVLLGVAQYITKGNDMIIGLLASGGTR